MVKGTEAIKVFLARAKMATYASGDSAAKRRMEDGGIEMSFAEDGLSYRDRWYGGEPYLGEEIVFDGQGALWGMNYHGSVAPGAEHLIDGIYAFLQEALRHKDAELPLRGPAAYARGDFDYAARVRGGLGSFLGEEVIRHRGIPAYQGNFHGGLISSLERGRA
jgi:hypothetical protein